MDLGQRLAAALGLLRTVPQSSRLAAAKAERLNQVVYHLKLNVARTGAV